MATGQSIKRTILGTVDLPTVERNYGIHYQLPFVGSEWHVDWIGLSETWYYYEEGSSTRIPWYDYSANCNELRNARNYRYWADFTAHHAQLLNGISSQYYETDVWDALVADFQSDVSWLWGSIGEGGVFIVKAADNPSSVSSLSYWICMCWGVYESTGENSVVKLAIQNAGSNRHALSLFNNVGWFVFNNTTYFDGQNPGNSYAYYSMFLTDGQTWRCGSIDFGIQTNVDPRTATTDTRFYPHLTTYGFYVEAPSRAWNWETSSHAHHVDIYAWSPDPDEWTQLEGVPENGYDENPAMSYNPDDAGGYGTPDNDGDDVSDESLTDLNSLTAINSGLVTLYRPSSSELTSFANFLYSGITDSIANQLKKLVTNPLEYVIFVALCKFAPPVDVREEIAFCGIGTSVYSDRISSQFYDLDCGVINFRNQFNSFLDYAPNSKLKIYLPYCGIHELSIDDCVGSEMHVKYRIDLLSGSCAAKITISRETRGSAPQDCRINSIVYEYTGNVYLTMPLSATDWRGTYSSLVSLAGGVIGGAVGGVGGAIAIGSSVANSVLSQKVSVNRSGQIGSCYGYLGQNKPYLILERPIQAVANQFGNYEGFVSNTLQKVSSLSGYTEIDTDTCWSNNFGYATKEECDMIKDIMNKGVYL